MKLQPKLKFQQVLKHYMDSREMTLKELAQASGVSQAYLTQLANGTKENPSRTYMELISKALRIPLEYLSTDNFLEHELDVPEYEWDDVEKNRFNITELSHSIPIALRTIDGIEVNDDQARQIVNFARFLVLQQEVDFELIIEKVMSLIKERKGKE